MIVHRQTFAAEKLFTKNVKTHALFLDFWILQLIRYKIRFFIFAPFSYNVFLSQKFENK